MLEDIRNHDAIPTDEERAWMRADPLAALVRVVALAALAIAIGLTGSELSTGTAPAAVVAKAP
jgi:hypothetical protein